MNQVPNRRLLPETQLRDIPTDDVIQIRAKSPNNCIRQRPHKRSTSLDTLDGQVLEDNTHLLRRVTGSSAPLKMTAHQEIRQIEASKLTLLLILGLCTLLLKSLLRVLVLARARL
ncbi:hypothetical protein BDV18DRAFT_149431 [Aspergillus unguis]